MTVEEILKEHSSNERELVPILRRIQTDHGHIPRASIPAVARHLRLTPSEVYGVVTFDPGLILEPETTARS
jgi:NADH:ubiquinone oxidoreductase subunit E